MLTPDQYQDSINAMKVVAILVVTGFCLLFGALALAACGLI